MKDHIHTLTAAMLRPEFYPDRPSHIEIRQTHISCVFLAADHVYKIKKPLQLPFLDYSTLSKRRYFCGEEVRLNRRLAPHTYLGVVAISRAHGTYLLDEMKSKGGRIVEYAVKMNRLPEEWMLSSLVERNAAEPIHVLDIANKLVAFHEKTASEKATIYGAPQAIARNVRDNFDETRRFIGHTISQTIFKTVQAYSEAFLTERSALLESRVTERRVRDGHGDLRAEHICLVDNIEIYDCVEFNEGLRYSDVASEVAFLSMDLDFAGAANLSDKFASAYAAAARDDDLPALLPFYKCYRAYVRGKVDSLKSEEAEVNEHERRQASLRALQYFLLAMRYAKGTSRPKLFVVCGMAATGKSTVARLLSARTGFPVFDSDHVRKQLAGMSPTTRSGETYQGGIYSQEFTRRTYESLLEAAHDRLASGEGAIIAATFADAEFRRRALERADRLHAPVIFVECRSDEDTIKQRLRQRESDSNDASDASWSIYQRMRDEFHQFSELPAQRHFVIDTDRGLLSDLAALEETI
ncbi:MAG: AAA family ATPase [Candidatus Binatia bacterium]